MPELPEAETLVRQLRGALSGCVLSKIIVRRPDMVTRGLDQIQNLEGQKVIGFLRRGKYIAVQFERDFLLWFHLGMTGRLYLKETWDPREPHLHLVLEWKDRSRKLLFQDVRRFGQVFLTPKNSESFPEGLRKMGPEPLEISLENFQGIFKGRTGPIKNLLMNQRLVAGIGNIYADESLFRAGILPKKRAGRLNQEKLKTLHLAICGTLNEAVKMGGSTIRDYISLEGQSGGFQKYHKVYGKQGQPCPVCGAPIRRIVLAGRSSFFCPKCQA